MSPIRAAVPYVAMANLEPYGFPDTLERLWLEPQSEDTFKVSCVPFRVYGLTLGDRVRLDLAGRQVAELLEKSEHRVFASSCCRRCQVSKATRLHDTIDDAVTQSHLKSEWSGVWALIKDADDDGSIAWELGDGEQFQPGDVK